ncbi:MAG: ATP-binding cassette domain-containing protein [Lachnospiraceae bacterium]|nr:ATP-binding cassette domain-containing protein [Lachnospiraceae bacterium]
MAQFRLRGKSKYLTGNPGEIITVVRGSVYVYVVRVENGKPTRSFMLCEVEEGQKIPSFSVVNNEDGSFLQFLLTARAEAVIATEEDQAHLEEIRKEFLKKHTNIELKEARYSQAVGEWYESNLSEEQRKIKRSYEQKEAATKGKINLMTDVFRSKKVLHYDEQTDSLLYNTVALYCDYLQIPVCSYASIHAAFGNDFTIYDIARSSHFVLRKIKLAEKWYKRDAGAIIVLEKETEKPMLCVPRSTDSYLMYDLERGTNIVVEREEAASLSEDAYVAYRPFDPGALTVREALKFGLRNVKKSDAAIFLLLSLFITWIGMLLPILNERLFDHLIPMAEIDPILQIGVVIFAVMTGNVFFELVRSLGNFRMVKTVEYSIVSATYDRLFRLPQHFIERFGTAELVNRINAINGVFSTTVSAGLSAVIGFLMSLFYLYKMFDKSHTLAWRGLIMGVIAGVGMYGISRIRIIHEKRKLVSSTKANGLLYGFVAGILKIKSSGIENRSLLEFEKVNTDAMKNDIRSGKVANAGTIFNAVSGMFYTGFIFYTVVKKKETLTVGEYTAFNSAYGMFTSALSQLITYFITHAQLVPVMERIRPIFEEEVEVKPAMTLPGKLSGAIEVDHLDFSYEDDEEKVLNDISFSAKPGEFIGIVGPSGCGKSTLLKCLLGFEKPTKGKVFYDNKETGTMDQCEMRKQLGVVLQDGKMVAGNIYTNVSLACPNMEPSDVVDLLEEVGMGEDIRKMPMGIFTAVSEGGGTLSGGQQQRVLIARALANRPNIAYFDEATSALDNVTQQVVCESLENRKMTRVMIAHRLSTVRNCDKILVMEHGSIVESGNFDELMEKKGLFYELAKRQQL